MPVNYPKTVYLFLIVVLCTTLSIAHAQERETRLATAQGKGTLKVGGETFKITSVVVKLLSDKSAEITLVSDITVFLSGTWTDANSAKQGIDLQITSGQSAGGLEATGKVFLSADGKSVSSLSIKGSSRTTKRHVDAQFQGS
jgi:hypothetical protein